MLDALVGVGRLGSTPAQRYLDHNELRSTMCSGVGRLGGVERRSTPAQRYFDHNELRSTMGLGLAKVPFLSHFDKLDKLTIFSMQQIK